MRARHPDPRQLLEFPCEHEFKAFGRQKFDRRFKDNVCSAIAAIVPVPADSVRVRTSSRGSYICVSVKVRLLNFEQMKDIYAALRRVKELEYLL
jgi:putative lipoic acid-binding regulatory protein